MSFTLPKFSIPYFGLPYYAIPYATSGASPPPTPNYDDGEVLYLGVPTGGIPDYAVADSAICGTYYSVIYSAKLLSPRLYKAVSDIYHDAYAYLQNQRDILDSSTNHIASITNAVAKVELMQRLQILNTNSADVSLEESLVASVSAINNHVITRGTQTLNEYLSENNIKVKSNWATLSELANFTIDEENKI